MSVTTFPVLTSVVLSPKAHADQTIAGGLIITDYLTTPQVVATDHFVRPGSGPSAWTEPAFAVSNGAYNAFAIDGQGSLSWASTDAVDTPPDVVLHRSAARTLDVVSLDATPAVLRVNGLKVGATDVGAIANLPALAGLPDGYEVICYVASPATGNVVWHLRKIGSWFFVGGSGLYAFEQALHTAPAAYAADTPTVTVPRAGLYQIEWGFQAISNAPNTATYVQSALAGPGWTINEPVLTGVCVYANLPNAVSMVMQMQVNAGGAIAPWFNGVGAGAISSFRRWLRVTPVWMT